ncbi:hypothetical protein [Cloacibacillus evryensis]|uniref:hypothetical protein n=1 Tax=Cloacibacillus evryensis TaxID=508460 RepID=UPI00241C222A|nr:hypothetical protein [Cloacibacillus evryensis]
MKRVIIAIIITVTLLQQTAYAKVYYSGPIQVEIVESQTSVYTGLLAGLVASMIASSASAAAQPAQPAVQNAYTLNITEKQASEVRADLQKLCASELKYLVQTLNKEGTDTCVDILRIGCMDIGAKYDIDKVRDITSVTYTDDRYEKVTYKFVYLINKAREECRVRVTIPQFGFTESASASFKEPQPKSMIPFVEEYLGLTFRPDKVEMNDYYGYEIKTVTDGGRAAHIDLRPDDVIIAVDRYLLKDHSLERFASYIALRQKQKAMLKLTIFRVKDKKIIHMPL